MHTQEDGETDCICTRYTGSMVSRAKDTHRTNRVVRVDDETWQDYEKACEASGVTRADDLRDHMHRKIRAWKRKKEASDD